jgi:hypothetical protein
MGVDIAGPPVPLERRYSPLAAYPSTGSICCGGGCRRLPTRRPQRAVGRGWWQGECVELTGREGPRPGQ